MWYRIVATSHIAAESARRIERLAGEFAPDAVAIELDRVRLQALLQRQRPSYSLSLVRVVGLRGYLFALIGGLLQRHLGRIVDVAPGSDMLAGVAAARQRRVQLLLIDRPIQVTLRRLSAAMGWSELRQLFRDLWQGLRGRERLRFDLRRVPSRALVARLLAEFEERYPRPYAVLVEERNRHMARALRRYHELHPARRVLVVVGAGHADGLAALLQQEAI